MLITNPIRTSPALSAGKAAPTTPASGMAAQGLKSDDFLPLLLAQLQYQNPLEGLDTKDMFNQFASLLNMQQLGTLGNAIADVSQGQQTTQALALVGKNVEASVNNQRVVGRVSGLTLEPSGPMLIVNNHKVAISDLKSVTN